MTKGHEPEILSPLRRVSAGDVTSAVLTNAAEDGAYDVEEDAFAVRAAAFEHESFLELVVREEGIARKFLKDSLVVLSAVGDFVNELAPVEAFCFRVIPNG